MKELEKQVRKEEENSSSSDIEKKANTKKNKN